MSASQVTNDSRNNSENNPLMGQGITEKDTSEQHITGDHNQVIDQLTGGAAIANVEGTVNFFQQTDPEAIKRIVREELRLPQRDRDDAVKVGFSALAEMMQTPEVHTAVIAFRIDFQATCMQINIITNYKEIHDQLHLLELNCYNQILQSSKSFPNNEVILTILSDNENFLQETIETIQDIVERKTISTQEDSWIQNLKEAKSELHAAIDEQDLRKLQRTIWLLNRVLAIQPSRINTQLNAAARTLRLASLVQIMQTICSTQSDMPATQKKLSELQQGMQALTDLDQRLSALIITHDYWQELDSLLRYIEANLDKDVSALDMSWPDLKEKTATLFNTLGDPWTDEFQKDSHNLEQALATQNFLEVKKYFRSYRRKASNRFFQVDATLLRLCGELRDVGEPLASLLRMME
jgi:hypothetical protein